MPFGGAAPRDEDASGSVPGQGSTQAFDGAVGGPEWGSRNPVGYNAPMIHEVTGTVTTYYGVDLDSPSHSDLSVLPLDRRVRQLVSGIDPMIGWYWTTHEGRIRVWFRDKQHAEQFRRSLFG